MDSVEADCKDEGERLDIMVYIDEIVRDRRMKRQERDGYGREWGRKVGGKGTS
jgi:hypothetical protein